MDKYLIPGATLLGALMIVMTFRYEVQPQGFSSTAVIVRDRWTGVTMRCASQGNTSMCLPFLTAGYRPIRR